MGDLEVNTKRLDEFQVKHLELIESPVALKKYLRKIKYEGLRKNTIIIYVKAFCIFLQGLHKANINIDQ